MVYLIVKSRWPSESTPEVIKMAIESATKYPPDASLGEAVVPNAVNADYDGYKTIGVTLVKEGEFE
ncbi:MAG: hypothetical protein ACXAAI_13710, partial [Promethearchaeota archaeon]